MGLNILAEALARIEHKLDYLLRHHNVPIYPMHFSGNICPTCNKQVEYLIDVKSQVVVRRCDCGTGKVPSAIPSLPVVPSGTPNGYSSADTASNDGTQESSRRKAR
jgi:hypothetical protein